MLLVTEEQAPIIHPLPITTPLVITLLLAIHEYSPILTLSISDCVLLIFPLTYACFVVVTTTIGDKITPEPIFKPPVPLIQTLCAIYTSSPMLIFLIMLIVTPLANWKLLPQLLKNGLTINPLILLD